MIVTAIAVIILTWLSYSLAIHAYELYKYRHIPGVSQLFSAAMPFRIPFLAPYLFNGNYKTLVELSTRFKQYPVFKVTSWKTTWIIMNSMDAVKHVMLKNAQNYPKPPDQYSALLLYGQNIVSAPGGDIHKKHRKIIDPAFDEKHLRHLVEISNESTDMLINKLENTSSDKVTMEASFEMTELTMDIIGKSNFGSDLNIYHKDPNAKHTLFDKTRHQMSFYDALEKANTLGIALFAFIPESLHWLPIFNPIMKYIVETRKYIEDLIELRTGKEEYLDLLSMLVKSNEHTDNKVGRLNMQEIVSDSFIFLFAGHETSATNLGHLLYEITKNQEVQKKLQEEIDTVMNGKTVTYDDIPNLPYLNYCIKESLRLHSPVNVIPKVAKNKDEICGYSIPKGSMIFVNFYSVHWDDANWAEAKSFKPERFGEKYDPLAFLSFSYGKRKCVGFNFSIVETAAIMAKLVQRYDIHFEEHVDAKTYKPTESSLVTVKIDKLNLVLKKRTPQ